MAYGPTRPTPNGIVDQAISVLSANTRPWNRCGTLTWTIVVYNPLTRVSHMPSPNAPAATTARLGRAPVRTPARPSPTVHSSIADIRRRLGPPQNVSSNAPSTPPRPAPNATRPSWPRPAKYSTRGDI